MLNCQNFYIIFKNYSLVAYSCFPLGPLIYRIVIALSFFFWCWRLHIRNFSFSCFSSIFISSFPFSYLLTVNFCLPFFIKWFLFFWTFWITHKNSQVLFCIHWHFINFHIPFRFSIFLFLNLLIIRFSLFFRSISLK